MGLAVRVVADGETANLAAAYEVAIYRIAQEALTNVAKHAQASLCIIRLACDGALVLEIRDDGVGIAQNRTSGVGLHSMVERAEELGGTCTVTSGKGGGTTVRASLPLRSSYGADPNPDRG